MTIHIQISNGFQIKQKSSFWEIGSQKIVKEGWSDQLKVTCSSNFTIMHLILKGFGVYVSISNTCILYNDEDIEQNPNAEKCSIVTVRAQTRFYSVWNIRMFEDTVNLKNCQEVWVMMEKRSRNIPVSTQAAWMCSKLFKTHQLAKCFSFRGSRCA